MVLGCVLGLFLYSFSGAGEGKRSYSLGLDLGYLGPNVWAGWRTTEGPVFQPTTTFSVSDPFLGDFTLGNYLNMYGSQKDRIRESTGGYKSGYNSLSMGTVDEVQFFGEWARSWNDFSLSVSYWHLSYTWNTNILEWFGQYSSGEMTLAPSYKIGDVTLFTQQNMVVVANSRGDTVEVKKDSSATEPQFDLNQKKTDIGSYHAVYGISWDKEMGNMGMNLGVKTEWATYKFIEPWIWDGDIKNHKPSGFYHLTFSAGNSYSPYPWLSISANYGIQYMLNKWVDLDKRYKGSVPYAGIHTSFTLDL